MTIEIHEPELQALIAQRMESGAFQGVEGKLLHALKSAPLPLNPNSGQRLVEVCATVSGLTDDVDFSRNPSTGRLPGRRLKLDPPLIRPAERHIDLADEEIYELTELP